MQENQTNCRIALEILKKNMDLSFTYLVLCEFSPIFAKHMCISNSVKDFRQILCGFWEAWFWRYKYFQEPKTA